MANVAEINASDFAISRNDMRQVRRLIAQAEQFLDALPALGDERLRLMRVALREQIVSAHMATLDGATAFPRSTLIDSEVAT